jgi:hypothetical protein
MNEPRADLRRYPRVRVAWKVIIDVPGSRPRMRRTVDVSPFGVKVRLDSPLHNGVPARLRFVAPDRQPLEVRAVASRVDADGPVFVFLGVGDDLVARMKALVDSYRSG